MDAKQMALGKEHESQRSPRQKCHMTPRTGKYLIAATSKYRSLRIFNDFKQPLDAMHASEKPVSTCVFIV